jgi:DNA polymerase elongation subunit (family B)
MSDKTRIDTILQTQLGNDKSRRPLRTHVVGTSIVRRKKFYGFTNDATFPFCAVKFKSEMAMKRAKYKFQPYDSNQPSRWTIYEANLDPVLRFIHMCDIESTGWISVPDEFQVVEDKQTFCDEEYTIPSHKYVKKVELDSVCPLIVCSFDIEVYSEDGSFPDPASTTNYCPVIQIANTYQRYGEVEPFKRELNERTLQL